MIEQALVVGCGSIGLRHIRNLAALGVADVAAVDPAGDRRAQAAAAGATPVETLDAGLARGPRLALICTPPHLHLASAAAALAAGVHVFVEKPIAASLDGVDELLARAEMAGLVVAVGYNLRFHAGLRQLKALLDEGRIGRLLAVSAEFGQFLGDWRPGRDYRSGYNAFASQGGGIVLDGSHEIDYVRWIVGGISAVSAVTGRIGDLAIEAEDIGLLVLRFESGVVGHIHVDSLQRGYSRWCKLIGSTGSLVWEFRKGVRLIGTDGGETDYPIAPDVNDMYLDELRHVLRCVRGEERPLVTGEDGRQVLAIALAARQASADRREVAIG